MRWWGDTDMDSRWTRAHIDLDALAYNVRQFRRHLPATVQQLAVVKANAYGHGAFEVATAVLRAGVTMLGVALIEEAVTLRVRGIVAPILVLGYTPHDQLRLAQQHRLHVTMYDHASLVAAGRVLDCNDVPLSVHVKVDTGMGRIGFTAHEAVLAFLRAAQTMGSVRVDGLYTHFARAEEVDKTFSWGQHHRFQQLLEMIAQHALTVPLVHAGNSAIAIELPACTQQMVRLGIGMYGVYPTVRLRTHTLALRPVLSLTSRLVMVKTLPPGSPVSYGGRYVTTQEETIATIPIGYADGFSRALSGQAEMLLSGVRVRVVGAICMDQCMVRLPRGLCARIGDDVVIIGRSGDQTIFVDELAAMRQTIPYEVLCGISERVPRLYYDGASACGR